MDVVLFSATSKTCSVIVIYHYKIKDGNEKGNWEAEDAEGMENAFYR
jgi:hypothetical protein